MNNSHPHHHHFGTYLDREGDDDHGDDGVDNDDDDYEDR